MEGTSSVPRLSDRRLAEIVRRLVAAYRPERVSLFGSTARREAGPESDYDIRVVVDDEAPPDLKRSRRAYEVLSGLPRSGDILVWPRSAFERRLHLRASLPATILHEGELLHAA